MNQKPKEKYKFKVDNQVYETEHQLLSGKEILEISGHTPADRFRLDMQLKGGASRKISLNEEVDLSDSGIEKFFTIPLGPQEG